MYLKCVDILRFLIYVRYKFLEDYLCYIKLLKVEIKNKIYVKCFNYINK